MLWTERCHCPPKLMWKPSPPTFTLGNRAFRSVIKINWKRKCGVPIQKGWNPYKESRETEEIFLSVCREETRRGTQEEGGPLQARMRGLTRDQPWLIHVDYNYTRFCPLKSVLINPYCHEHVLDLTISLKWGAPPDKKPLPDESDC